MAPDDDNKRKPPAPAPKGEAPAQPAWLDDPDAPASEEELAASERLREELDDPGSKDPDVELIRALRHVDHPRAIEAATHKKILARALDAAKGESNVTQLPRRRGPLNVWYPIGALVAAAAVALVATSVIKGGRGGASSTGAPDRSMAAGVGLAVSRPADELFEGGFPKDQRSSERMDIIAEARGRDLRANMYARWGVK